LSDRLKYARGTRLMMGNALIARLFYSLRRRNVPILFDASIAEVEGDRHGVKGAQLKIGDRKILVKARKPQQQRRFVRAGHAPSMAHACRLL
jgi:thioredoxin reductase